MRLALFAETLGVGHYLHDPTFKLDETRDDVEVQVQTLVREGKCVAFKDMFGLLCFIFVDETPVPELLRDSVQVSSRSLLRVPSGKLSLENFKPANVIITRAISREEGRKAGLGLPNTMEVATGDYEIDAYVHAFPDLDTAIKKTLEKELTPTEFEQHLRQTARSKMGCMITFILVTAALCFPYVTRIGFGLEGLIYVAVSALIGLVWLTLYFLRDHELGKKTHALTKAYASSFYDVLLVLKKLTPGAELPATGVSIDADQIAALRQSKAQID